MNGGGIQARALGEAERVKRRAWRCGAGDWGDGDARDELKRGGANCVLTYCVYDMRLGRSVRREGGWRGECLQKGCCLSEGVWYGKGGRVRRGDAWSEERIPARGLDSSGDGVWVAVMVSTEQRRRREREEGGWCMDDGHPLRWQDGQPYEARE